MEEDIAALVRTAHFNFHLARLTAPQVIDNGSGMCKAGCNFFYTLWWYWIVSDGFIQSQVVLIVVLCYTY